MTQKTPLTTAIINKEILAAAVETPEEDSCIVCMIAPRDPRLALVPCGHHRFCPSFAQTRWSTSDADVRFAEVRLRCCFVYFSGSIENAGVKNVIFMETQTMTLYFINLVWYKGEENISAYLIKV